MKKKRILITGAGSGFGELTAIGLAKEGHDVIAGVQIWPQATAFRLKVEALGLKNLRVEKLDLLHPYDFQNAVPQLAEDMVKNLQRDAWENTIDLPSFEGKKSA